MRDNLLLVRELLSLALLSSPKSALLRGHSLWGLLTLQSTTLLGPLVISLSWRMSHGSSFRVVAFRSLGGTITY